MSTDFPDLASSGADVDSADPVGVPLVAALAELAGLMLASSDLHNLLEQISVLAARSASAVAGVDAYCGITISSEHGAYTVAASDARAAAVDEVQYANGDGPCLQSLRTGDVVSVPDLTVESRWGDYPAHALTEGVRSSLSTPMTADGATLGALNLYSTTVRAFGEQQQRDAAVFTATAAGAVAMVLRLGAQRRLSRELRDGLSTRAVIDQAIGIVIGNRRCTPEEAFTYLRTASQHRNVKLRDIATELVESMSRTRTAASRTRGSNRTDA
jgi:GAF domain-containing protein